MRPADGCASGVTESHRRCGIGFGTLMGVQSQASEIKGFCTRFCTRARKAVCERMYLYDLYQKSKSLLSLSRCFAPRPCVILYRSLQPPSQESSCSVQVVPSPPVVVASGGGRVTAWRAKNLEGIASPGWRKRRDDGVCGFFFLVRAVLFQHPNLSLFPPQHDSRLGAPDGGPC